MESSWAQLLEYTVPSSSPLTPLSAGATPMLCRPKITAGVLTAVLQRIMGEPLPGGKPGVPRPQCIQMVRLVPPKYIPAAIIK